MAYAKLNRLVIENFMSIAHADMNIGAITNICGYNDQGKSAIRTALSVLMYDSDSTEQINYIKVGTEYFRVTAIFEDGVSVSKEKRSNGASIWTMQRDNEVLYSNLSGDKVIAVDGVPEAIAMYWGVYADEATGQLLNVRIDSDPYFLVSTSGGDNYKILNPLLHGDVLSKASAALITDSNACKAEADEQAVRYNMYLEQLEQNEAPTVEMINGLKQAESSAVSCAGRQEKITNIRETESLAKDTDIPPMLNTVSVAQLEAINTLLTTSREANEFVWNSLQAVDMQKWGILEELMRLETQDADVAPVVTVVNTAELNAMANIKSAYDSLMAEQTELNAASAELETVQSEVKATTAELAKLGYKVCKNCGSLVE